MSLVIDDSALSNKLDNDSNGGNTSNSDNPNENGKRMKNTRNRPCKSERFEKEREEFVKNLEIKMGLTKEIRGLILNDLEQNNELKTYLKSIIPEIRKLYKCGCWNYFIQKEENRDEIGLLKSIFKSENYKLISKRKFIEKEGIKKQYSCIFFYKDYELNEIIKL